MSRRNGHSGSRRRRIAAVAAVVALALAGCGGRTASSTESNDQGSGGNAQTGTASTRGRVYELRLATDFQPLQEVGRTSLMHLRFENIGEEPVPELNVAFTATADQERPLPPFAIQEQAPRQAGAEYVWLLAPGYPRIEGTGRGAGVRTTNQRTFLLGPLRPGRATATVWKMRAIRKGRYRLDFRVNGDLSPRSETRVSPAPGDPTSAQGPYVKSFHLEIFPQRE